jgi:acetyl esterase/lipase
MSNPEIDAIRELLKSGPRPVGLAARRQRLDDLGGHYAMAPDIRAERIDADGVPAERTIAPGSDENRVLLFLHGGGYMSGSIDSHRHMVAEAGRQTGCRTLALGYRLAPEHPFPAALEDTVSAYKFLLASGVSPDRIALAGESAGGGLAVATLVTLRDAGVPLPACVWCSSPWVDLEMKGASIETKAGVDPLIQRGYLTELATAYLNGADPATPLISPIHADLRGLPPMLIQVGSSETLLDDAVRLAQVAGAAEVSVTLQIWPEMIHAFTLFYQQLAKGREALASVGGFVRGCLAG